MTTARAETEAQRLIRRLLRQARAATWIAAASRALLVVAAALVVIAIVVRVFGGHLAPSSWWTLGIAPVLAAALFAVWRSGALDAATGAILIDRRLGLDGLLLAAREVGAGAWDRELAARLDRADRSALPRLHLAAAARRAAQAAGLVAIAALLPAPEAGPAVASYSPAIEQAVEDLLEDVELAKEAGVVADAEGEELERRARALQQRLVDGDAVAWSDVDALRDELSHQQLDELRDLQAARDGFRKLAEQAAAGSGRLDAGQVAELGAAAAERGLLDGLPADERERFERLMQRLEALQDPSGPGAEGGGGEGSGGFDPTDAGLDAESLARLAQAMAELSGNRLRRAADAARLPPEKLADLRAALEASGALAPGEGAPGEVAGGGMPGGGTPGGEGFDPNPGPDGDGEGGRGGINRGAGDASLDFLGASVVDTAGLRPERLPPGVAIPDKWMTIGVGRARPDVAPGDPAAGGGAAAAGAGGAAWRRELAPRHRDAVKRFFGESR